MKVGQFGQTRRGVNGSSVLLGDVAAGKREKKKSAQGGLAVVGTFWLVLVLVPPAVAGAASWRTIWEGSWTTISVFPRYSTICPVTHTAFPLNSISGGLLNLTLFDSNITTEKVWSGNGRSKFKNVGLAADDSRNRALATKPQTVFVSPMCCLACSAGMPFAVPLVAGVGGMFVGLADTLL
jgi:hypothetical protein